MAARPSPFRRPVQKINPSPPTRPEYRGWLSSKIEATTMPSPDFTYPAANHLCSFVAHPFPNEKQAHELLSAIETIDGPVDFERALFCFQVAYYFLAWLALGKAVADERLQKESMDELHEQIRAYFGPMVSKVRVSGFIIDPIERKHFIEVIRAQLKKPSDISIDISNLVMNKLTLFDFLCAKRIKEYHAAMLRPSPHSFYFVAERMFEHMGAKKNPVLCSIIANILQGNSALAEKTAIENPPRPSNAANVIIPFSPSLPDITQTKPISIFASGSYLFLHCRDVNPISGDDIVKYKQVIALIDRRDNHPKSFVTLEESPFASNVLCVFELDGRHSNFGSLQGQHLEQQFVERAIALLRERFGFGDIEALEQKRERSRWNFW